MAGAPRISFDPGLPTPAYRQIADQIRTLCVEQLLAPGDELPSVRRLALDLGLHFNTVADAYRLLAEEGWLEILHGRGARVRWREKPSADQELVLSFRRALRQFSAEMQARGMTRSSIARELTTWAEGLK